ncbi:YqaJ viral recombinase family protein [Clostridium tertium]|uniref:YqaJ viral recombinase family nuclease n=1 Tax=Clostridium tertium TaxID=1559 RepID=UPI0018A03C85|nr:YqaJ viral recombinase family protein [Clostridium tertium]MDB1947643.1 YqaJ viral recombinase family protein [Clostridium tertium]MDB1956359.1 YqaJ viral recombinase family protein [Clostridium tertium]MDB1959655.1 YqaJ viral recombinase family protein [Clostridium tertium]MDB1961549.1 YqaJ viral recombinase family protein [Clostridium tertium]MDB1967281.1 YqaJ viral recombinase family protein [Clostridium tertium]
MDKLEWLKERQCGIGGSDVGAILGVNKYKTAFEVYLEKTEPIIGDGEQSESAYFGDIFEDVVAKEFEKRTGKKVRRDRKHYKHKEYHFMVANIDRRVVGENAILECKTANQFLANDWEGEEIPASYLLQVQHYLFVTEAELGYIAVLIGGQKFIWKQVQRDEELIEMIIEAENEFWKMVEDKTPPPLDGSSAAEKYLLEKYSNAEVGKIEELGLEYKDKIKNLFELKYQKDLLDTQIKEIENQIKFELKDAEIGFVPGYSVSWKNVSSNRVDSKKLRVEYPDIYKEVLKESKSRRFSIKEDK